MDLLTLKDNSASAEDYATSLHLLTNEKVGSDLIMLYTCLITNRIFLKREGNLLSALYGGVFICTMSVSSFCLLKRPMLTLEIFSWETLQKTSDVSDDELNSRYQETALYSTLMSALQREDGPLIPPSEALLIPKPDEMVSRWPGMSTDQIEALEGDYISEQDRLGELELDDIFTRIHELAVHAIDLEEE